MNTLLGIVTSAERLAGWVWQASWQASLLVVLVLVIQRLFRSRLSAGWRYALWLLVLARMMTPAAPESALSLFNYARWDFVSPTPATPLESAKNDALTPKIVDFNASRSEGISNLPLAGHAEPHAAATITHSDAPRLMGASWSIGRWLALGWLSGALVFLMIIAWVNGRFAWRLQRFPKITDPAVLGNFEGYRQIMGIKSRIRLIRVPEGDGPALFGLFHLRLLLPSRTLERLSAPELRHVFIHELAHVRRWDVAVNWLMTLMQVIHWFNPVVWFGFARMRSDRELACDALVLGCLGGQEKVVYGETILKLMGDFVRPAAIPRLVGILENKSQIERRIIQIAQYKGTSQWPAWSVLLLIGLGLVALTNAQTRRSNITETPKQTQTLVESSKVDRTLSAETKQNTSDSTMDLLEFFKSAISSPPDVQRFYGVQRVLSERNMPAGMRSRIGSLTNRPPLFYEGARSGSNYFLRSDGDINKLTNNAVASMVVGRAGAETYHFNPNTVTYTFDQPNASSTNHFLLSLGASYYSMVRQFLNMGLPDIRTGTVKWQGNGFTASKENGASVYGMLEITNGLPCQLSISKSKGGKPYTSFRYVYPAPPSVLGGFPEKIISLVSSKDELLPLLELTLLRAQLAKEPLSETNFSMVAFLGTNIQYTNVVENGVLISLDNRHMVIEPKVEYKEAASNMVPPFRKPRPTVSPKDEFPRAAWKFVGYATPEDALQSSMWAGSQGDVKAILASIIPAERQELLQYWGSQSEKEISEMAIKGSNECKGYCILKRDVLTDDQVVLTIYREEAVDGIKLKRTLRRVGRNWGIEVGGNWRIYPATY